MANLADGVANMRTGFMDYFSGRTDAAEFVGIMADALQQQTQAVTSEDSNASRQAVGDTFALNSFTQSLMNSVRGVTSAIENISETLANNATAIQNKIDINFAQSINDQLKEAQEQRALTTSEQMLLNLSQQVLDGQMNALDFRLLVNTDNSQYFIQTNRQQRQSLSDLRQSLREAFSADYLQSLAQARQTLENMDNYALANGQNARIRPVLNNLKLSSLEYSLFGTNLLSSSLFSGSVSSVNRLSPLQQVQQLHNYDNIEDQIKFDWQTADTTQLQNNNLIQARQQLDNIRTQVNALENEALKQSVNDLLESKNVEEMTFDEVVQMINDINSLVSKADTTTANEQKFNDEVTTAAERVDYLGTLQDIYTQMANLQQMLSSSAKLVVETYKQRLEELSQQVKDLLSNDKVSEQAKDTLDNVDANALLNYVSFAANGIVSNRVSEQIINKINEQLKAETDESKKAELQSIIDIFELLSNDDYSDPVKMQELNKQAMVKISQLFESYYNNYWAGLDTAIDGYIQQYLATNKDQVLRDIDESLRALDEEYSTDKARESKDYQDAKKNLETAKANIENYGNLEAGPVKTTVTGIIIKSMGFEQTQEMRNAMAQSIRDGANESDLSFAEELALTLKLGEIAYGIPPSNSETFNNINTRNEEGVVHEGDAITEDNIMNVDFGNGILSQSATKGKSTVKQVLMLCENLLGRVSALSAGGGKSFVFAWTMNMYFHTTGEAGVAEFLAAKPGDAAQFISNTHAENPILLKALGLEKVDGNAYYNNNDFRGLADQYTDQIANGAKGRLVAYATGTRGFVELQARVGEGEDSKILNSALNNVSMRVADEADVAALSRVAFILGSGNDTVPLDVAKKSVSMLQFLQGINTEAVVDATDLAGMQFTMKDGKVICSNELQAEIDNKYSSDTDKALISNVMRAMYQMARKANGQESVAFVNGQPASIEAGTLQENTTDQSSAYNVALVALQIQNQMQLDGKSITDMKFKDFKYGEYDVTQVKMSVSSGESTLSQIFSRGQASTLNCGGSATLDVAREVAHTIFGGQAIDIEASSIESTKTQLKDRFNVERSSSREAIIAENVDTAAAFLANGGTLDKYGNVVKDSGNNTVGLLFGAMDMSYNLEVMVRALAKLSQGTSKQFTYEQIMDATNGYTMTEVLNYISENYSDMQKYTSNIQIVDSQLAGTNADEIQKMTQNKGKLTFSNENALRGINWQSIDLILLDGQNFPSSELLQAIGRAGRNKEYGKDKCSVTIYTVESSLNDTIQEMRAIDQWYKQNQTGKSNLFDGLGDETAQRYQDLLYSDNISAVDLLEIVSVYKSMQLKSESIMFKANQEAMYILVKEALAEAATKAQQDGNIKDYEFLHALYLDVISHDESNLFGSFTNTTDMENYSNPIEAVRQTYLNALDKAIEYLGRAAEGVSDQMLRFQFELRLQDAQTAKDNDVFGMLNNSSEMENTQGFFNNTFAGATRDVDPMFGVSPATDIAKTLLKLAGNVLPTASANAQAQQQVTVNQAIAQNSSLSEQEQEYLRSDEAVERGYVYTNEDGVKVLSNKGDMLVKTLTGDDDWYKFFAWLFGVLGIDFDKSADVYGKADAVDSIWNKGYTDMTKLERFKDRMAFVDKETHFSEEDFKQMYTFTYPAGLSSFGLTIPSDSIAFANRVAGTTSDNDYFKSIREQYADIEEEYQKFVDSQGSNKLALNKIHKSVTALQNTVNPKIEDLTPIAQLPQLQEQLTEARYYNQQVDVIETENSLANIPAEIKAAMVQAGMAVTAATETAIANMLKVADQLSPEDRAKLFGEMKLGDIPKFVNITSALSLGDSEERFNNASYGTITGLLGFNKETGGIWKFISGIKDKIFGQTQDVLAAIKEQQARTQAARTEFFGIDPEDKGLTLSSIADYAYQSAVAVYSTDTYVAEPTQEQIDEELKLVFAYLYPTQDSEALLNKYKSMLTRGELGVAELLTKEEFGREDVYVTEDGKPSEGYVRAIEAKTYEQLMGVTKIGNSASKDSLRAFGIVYDGAKSEHDIDLAGHYGEMVSFFKSQGLTKEQAQDLAKTFTIGELSDPTFRSGLKSVVREGLITIGTGTTRQSIIGSVRGLTNEQIRREGLEISDISPLLTMAGLDAEQIQRNEDAITLWMSDSEVVRTFGEDLTFEYEVGMTELSSATFVKDRLSKESYTDVLKNQYGNMTYSDYMNTQVSSELSLKDTREFFKLLGLDYDNVIETYNGLREYVKAEDLEEIETIVADKMADRDMGIKEFNEEVANQVGAILDNFVGSATVEQLSDPKYIEGVKALMETGVITPEDIASGKTIGEIIKGKKVGEVRAALGTEYDVDMKAFGLDNVVDNTKKLEDKYNSDVEKAVISEMNITELTDVEDLINNEDKMKTKVISFGDTLTMNMARSIAEREGIDLVGIVTGATRYLGYATYDRRAEELKKAGVDVDALPIKTIIDNDTIVEEVKGLKALGFAGKDIEGIIKEAGKAKKTIADTIKGKSISEFEAMTNGMSEEDIDKLYKYLGMNRKTVEKNTAEVKKGIEVPEEFAMENVTVGEVNRTKDTSALARKVNARVTNAKYNKVTVSAYQGLNEQDKAKYGADQAKIDARIGELVTGDDAMLLKYIVGGMSVQDLLTEGVAEKKIDKVMKNESQKNRYYNNMRAEDFMKATEVVKDGKVEPTETENKRKAILGDKYEMFMGNYKDLMADIRFGDVIKGVRVEVLSSDRAERSIEKAMEDQSFTKEQAEKIVLVIEESKAEESRRREVLGEKIEPVLEEVQVTTDTEALDCVEVAAETMGSIIPLKSLTEAALRANPFAQDKLKAAGVRESFEGTELGELRKKTGLSYATLSEQDIDLESFDSKKLKKEQLTIYMPETGEVLTVTGISKQGKEKVVSYTITTPEGEEIDTEKAIEAFDGLRGVVIPSAFISYKENAGSETGHVVTVTEIAGGYLTYTGTNENGEKIVETTTIDAFFKEEGFTGLMLAQAGQKGVSYLDSGVKEVIGEMFKNAKSKKYEDGKEMLEKIIDGVTAPGELNKALKYVLSIWNKDTAAMLKYIGLDKGDLSNKEAIIQGATRKITEAVALGKDGKLSEAEVKVEIELVTTLRDLLITTSKQDAGWLTNASEEEIMAKLIVSKAVNQNVIVHMFEKGIKTAVSDAKAGDFVIDVKKLQSTIVDKNLRFAKDAKIEDVMELLAGADKKYKTPMMSFSMRDIHAIAAAA